jgi:hypothetical protein
VASTRRTGPDLFGTLAVVLAVGAIGLYLGLTMGDEGEVAWWFLAGTAAAAFLAAYGATRSGRRRPAALTLSAGILLVLGVLALASIGLLLVVAAVMALIAAARARRETRSR